MKHFSYKIEHDFGLAPNPFGGYCTLAVCKPDIRRNKDLAKGSWIIGSGSKKIKLLNKLIFAMQVEEKLTFDAYWKDIRFQYKKPIINGSLVQMYGDNFYHRNEQGIWIQENSAHSGNNGEKNESHLKRDIKGRNVLVSTIFFYFGNKAISVPKEFVRDIFCQGRNMRKLASPSVDRFIDWLETNNQRGVLYGDPINWNSYH
jgi:hypothetical protein